MKTPLFPLLALLALAQCHKKDPTPQPPARPVDQLPPATQTGADTFGCLLNGQAWTPVGNPFAGPILTSHYSGSNFYLTVNRSTTKDGANVTQRIQIEMDTLYSSGVYSLRNATSRSAEYSDRESQCLFLTDSTHPAVVEITKLDLANRIVSGTFTFTLETPSCGQVVVSDGRFDTRF